MAMGKDNVAIEIASSPEPESSQKTKFVQPHLAKSYATSSVFELTDSDDGDDTPPFIHSKDVSKNATPGPSTRPKLTQKLPTLLDSSVSIDNIPVEHRRVKTSASKKTPLFLPSDEENAPPPELTFNIHYPARLPVTYVDTVTKPTLAPQPAPPSSGPSTQTPSEFKPRRNTDPDVASTTKDRIQEIIPDVEPDYLFALVTNYISDHPDQPQDLAVEQILHTLFEVSDYPKVDRMNKGKRKQLEPNADDAQVNNTPFKKKPKVDYSDSNRPFKPSKLYINLALEQLQTAFPFIPKSYVHNSLNANKGLYAPTHLSLLALEKLQQQRHESGEKVRLPYKKRVQPFRSKGKSTSSEQDPEFEAEHRWLLHELDNDAVTHNAGAREVSGQDDECEDGIECGCCFSACAFDKMIQCPETHLFCISCMKSYASTLLGVHDPNIRCMDQSGCKALISPSELARFLNPKEISLWERVKQRKEVEAAALEGLEECPFCDWGCVIENSEDKLFRCGNTEDCGAVSCRTCKKLDHLPKSCKEMEEDKHLGGRHAVEEAMSHALMRNCPKCQKPFIKEGGCNKMSCPNCQTISCYVCRQVIKGYDHFNSVSQVNEAGPSHTPKCLLWDSVEQRHADEVKAAAERAQAEYKSENPDVDDKAIKVDLPAPPPNPHATQLERHLQNAQAELNRVTAALETHRATETHHRTLMREHESGITLLLAQGKHNTDGYHALMAALAREQTTWYQMRIMVDNAAARVAQVRAQVELYQQQIAAARAQPAWNLNLNLNMYGHGANFPALQMPALPALPPIIHRRRRGRARGRRR